MPDGYLKLRTSMPVSCRVPVSVHHPSTWWFPTYTPSTRPTPSSSMRMTHTCLCPRLLDPRFPHISSWALLNNLRLNTSKSKEMVIRRRASRFTPPQSIEGVERVKTMKVLGVVLSEDLSAATHISGVLESCSRSMYAL